MLGKNRITTTTLNKTTKIPDIPSKEREAMIRKERHLTVLLLLGKSNKKKKRLGRKDHKIKIPTTMTTQRTFTKAQERGEMLGLHQIDKMELRSLRDMHVQTQKGEHKAHHPRSSVLFGERKRQWVGSLAE